VIEETLHRFSVTEVRGNDFGGIIGIDMGIEDAVRFDHHVGALLAKAVAAGEVNGGSGHALFGQLSL
jgi:hypothetical protein